MTKIVHFIDDDPRGSLLTSLKTTVQALGYQFLLHKGREAIRLCLADINSERRANLQSHLFLVDIAIPLSPAAAQDLGLQVEQDGLNGLILINQLCSLNVPVTNIALISNLTDIGCNEADKRQLRFFSKHDLNLIELKDWLKSGGAGSNAP